MDKILAVALTDLRVNFRERSTLIFLVLLPAFMVVVVAFANGAFATDNTERPRTRLEVVDNDNTERSAQFLQTLRLLDDNLILCPMDREGCDTEEISATLEIPAGFGEALFSDTPISVIYRTDEDPLQVSPVYGTIQAAASRVSGAVVARRLGESVIEEDAEFGQSVFNRASEIWATNPVSVAYSEAPIDVDSEEAVRAQPGFRQSVPGIGSMYVLFTVLAGTTILINERKNWTLQRLITMPVTGSQVIAGKMLARFIMGMLQYLVAFGIGMFFAGQMGFSFGNSPLALLLVMMSFTFFSCALALLLATVVSTEQQAGGVTTFLALTMAAIGGAWWSLNLEFIPDFMQSISYLSPIRYAMDGFSRVILNGGGIADVLPQVGILVGVGTVLFVIASRRFRIA
jgi:ABC-2 type transport system permease protein